MRKKLVLPASVFLIFFCFLPFSRPSAAQDEFLKVESSARPKRLSRGEEGKIILKLAVPEGVILSPQPSFIIEFNPIPDLVFPKTFFTASDLGIEILEEEGQSRLNLGKPIEIPFTVSPEANRGGHILEGRIKYFARSFKDDWCMKSTAKFSVALSTRPTLLPQK